MGDGGGWRKGNHGPDNLPFGARTATNESDGSGWVLKRRGPGDPFGFSQCLPSTPFWRHSHIAQICILGAFKFVLCQLSVSPEHKSVCFPSKWRGVLLQQLRTAFPQSSLNFPLEHQPTIRKKLTLIKLPRMVFQPQQEKSADPFTKAKLVSAKGRGVF